jgi:hypothetical protein
MPWENPLATSTQIVAIHIALLPTTPRGTVLMFGDWGDDEGPDPTQLNVTLTRLYRMDPEAVLTVSNQPTTNAFCGGQSFLADGRLLVAGGTETWEGHDDPEHPAGHYGGQRACYEFLPRANTWRRIADLNASPADQGSDSAFWEQGGGRWYPTVVTLGNGEVFAAAGHPRSVEFYPANAPRHNNNTPERYSPSRDEWELMTLPNGLTAPDAAEDYYPRFHLLPSGMLFSTSAGLDGADANRRIYDPYDGMWLDPEVQDLDILNEGGLIHNRSSGATSVLLPLLPPDYRVRILVCNSPDPTAFRIDVDSSPRWEPTVDREGTAAGSNRANACATLLPNGQVFVSGGWPGNYPGAVSDVTAVLRPEIYTPGINWSAGDFSNDDEENWQTIEQDAPNPRGYHSTALLLPDGRVWHGGSTTAAIPVTTEVDIFAPDYVADNGRPQITSCPPCTTYGQTFTVETPQAASIARVAFMRCGSNTHGFDADQRYVGAQFGLDGGDLRVIAPPNANVAPPGNYMLWIIDDDGRVCELASFIRISQQKLFISPDISTFSVHEVAALGTPASFANALHIACDGFLPHEVEPPALLIGGDLPGITAELGSPQFEAGAGEVDTAQRIVYPVRIIFENDNAFDSIPDDDDFLLFSFAAQMRDFAAVTNLQLSRNPNPRMSDGDPPWLSIDLRVFKTTPGESPTAGIEHPAAGGNAPINYINDVLDAYNAAASANHPFDDLSTEQDTNRLQVGINDENGDPAFNYAIARVRFRAPVGIDAVAVKVFFRMWTTGWTALEFDTSRNYRRTGNGAGAMPLLGIVGGEVSNIPCFASARADDMEDQEDPTNRRTLEGANAPEVHAYFGCWLDINDPTPRFPLNPEGNGPFEGDLLSIQELVARGLHQCLVAEIYYTLDPTINGATPGQSDNLAQRNLLLDDSDNPGGFAAHLVHHTYELKPSPFPLQNLSAPPVELGPSSTRGLHPDELAIDWGNLPRDSLVTFYMPQLNVQEIVREGRMRQRPPTLFAAGGGVLRLRVTDIGFIPIPGPLTQSIAGLMSVQLPPGVNYGDKYTIVLRQVAGRGARVLGTTQFDIRVRRASELRRRIEHNFAVLQHISLAIPDDNRWRPIFDRYLSEMGDRIRAFGGDPATIPPSPYGTPGGRPVPPRPERDVCCHEGKIGKVTFDCFGGFTGFVLTDCPDCKRSKCFVSCDRGLERVVMTAFRERIRVQVKTCCPPAGRPRPRLPGTSVPVLRRDLPLRSDMCTGVEEQCVQIREPVIGIAFLA